MKRAFATFQAALFAAMKRMDPPTAADFPEVPGMTVTELPVEEVEIEGHAHDIMGVSKEGMC